MVVVQGKEDDCTVKDGEGRLIGVHGRCVEEERDTAKAASEAA